MNDLKLLRLTGISGIIGAIVMFIGDIFMSGTFASGIDAITNIRTLVSDFPNARFIIGGILGPIAAIFYVIGCWHFYLALRPGSPTLSFATFLNFTAGMIVGGGYQASCTCIYFLFKTQKDLGNLKIEQIRHLMDYTQNYLYVLFGIANVFGLIGSLLFIFLILFRQTRYPKWMAFCNPVAILLANTFVRYAPSPIGGILVAGFLNLGFLAIFSISCTLLWRRGSRFV